MPRLFATVIAAIISLTSMAAFSASISDFVGGWEGRELVTPSDRVAPDDLDIEVAGNNSGFQLSWTDLSLLGEDGPFDARTIEARFTQSDRTGVFEYQAEGGSFLDRMFASPAAGNPLEGEILLWARIDTDALAVYSLTIDRNGGYELDHYTWTKTEDGLLLQYRQRTHERGEQLVVEGHLKPKGR